MSDGQGSGILTKLALVFFVATAPITCTQGLYNTLTDDNPPPNTEFSKRLFRKWGQAVKSDGCAFVEGLADRDLCKEASDFSSSL